MAHHDSTSIVGNWTDCRSRKVCRIGPSPLITQCPCQLFEIVRAQSEPGRETNAYWIAMSASSASQQMRIYRTAPDRLFT